MIPAMQEPLLHDVMSDPIIRMLMRHDHIEEEDIASLADMLAQDDE